MMNKIKKLVSSGKSILSGNPKEEKVDFTTDIITHEQWDELNDAQKLLWADFAFSHKMAGYSYLDNKFEVLSKIEGGYGHRPGIHNMFYFLGGDLVSVDVFVFSEVLRGYSVQTVGGVFGDVNKEHKYFSLRDALWDAVKRKLQSI